MRLASARACLASLVLASGLPLVPLSSASVASNEQIELAELMQTLSQVETAGGKFVEHKYLSLLSEPLTLRGRVTYRAPDYVEKAYDDPDGERYEVRGRQLTIELADGRRRELDIEEHPVLRAFVESYRGTLAGDLDTLRTYFDLELSGSMENWRLVLVPKQSELSEYLSAVVVLGRGATVYEVQTREAGGDYSVMRLEDSVE